MGVGAWAGGRDVSAGATTATKVTPKFWTQVQFGRSVKNFMITDRNFVGEFDK